LTDFLALPKSLRQGAALGLVALALGLAALVAIAPFARMAAVGLETDAATALIAQQERLLEAAARRPANTARDTLISGETSGMAGAELQRIISDLARRNGMALRSANVTPPKQENDMTVIGVDVSLQGQTEGLRAFLHAIETSTPILFIDTLSIKSVAVYQPVQQPVALDVTLRVRGYGAGKESN
jgi:general secretion pathway protein M